jgi:hypothetical protein
MSSAFAESVVFWFPHACGKHIREVLIVHDGLRIENYEKRLKNGQLVCSIGEAGDGK